MLQASESQIQKDKPRTSKKYSNNDVLSIVNVRNNEDQMKLEKQLEKELENSQSRLKQLQHQLRQESKKTPKSEIESVNELFQI